MAQILLPGLSPGTIYNIQVRATNTLGASEWSPLFSFTTPGDTLAPSPVTSLSWTVVGTAFAGTWVAPTTNADSTPLKDFRDYQVTLVANSITVIYYVTEPRFDLSFEQNKNAFGTPQATVQISVKARDISGNLSTVVTTSATNPAPAQPANLVVTAFNEALGVKWDAVADTDIDHYEVNMSTTGGFTPSGANLIYSGLGTGTTIVTAANYSPEFIKVCAVDVFGTRSTYASGSGTPNSSFIVDVTAPLQPTSLAATGVVDPKDPSGSNIIATVTWLQTSVADLAGFTIRYRKTGDTNWFTVDVNDGSLRAATITGLSPGTGYDFQIKSFDFSGNTAGFTATSTMASVTDTTAPAAPSGVVASAALTAVIVSWTENTETDVKNGAGTYEVQIATNVGFSTGVQTNKTTATVASFTGLIGGTTYWARVRAIDSSGNPSTYTSSTPASVNATAPTPSDGIAPASSPTPTVLSGIASLFVTWTPIVNNDPVTYEVHLSTSTGFTPSGATKVMEVSGSLANIKYDPTNTALAYGTTYFVKLIAKDHDGSAAAGTQGSGTIAKATSIDITTVTFQQVHDGSAPASSPTPTILSGLGYLFAYWTPTTNNDPVTYEVHVSTTTGFTPSGATKVMETSDSSCQIKTSDSSGTVLVYGTTYFVKLISKDQDGSAAAGTQGSGAISKVASTDITSVSGTLVHDGSAPASSPTPTLKPGLGYLYASWPATANNDPVTYEVHVSTSTGFTPSGSTKVMETTALSCIIKTSDSVGTILAYGTTYFVKLIAKDLDGSAAAGTQASASISQVAAADITANTITASQIAANTITASQIAATTITAGQIAANTITASQIAANTITAGQIAAATITGTQIAATTIAAGNIVAGTITATQIASSTITGTNISASTITGTNIAAGTITTSKLLVTMGGGNIMFNSAFLSSAAIGTNWGTVGATSIAYSSTHSWFGTQAALVTANGTGVAGTYYVPASVRVATTQVGQVYSSSIYVFPSITLNFQANLEWWTATVGGSNVSTTNGTAVSCPANTWTRVTVTGVVPATATALVSTFYTTSTPANGTTIYYDAAQLELGDVVTAYAPRVDEILPGTIVATMIAANTITAAQIAASTITTNEIAANTITAADIAAGTITATQIAASTITGGNIAATTITAANIAANTITAGQIAASTITSTQIAATTITASNIVSATITTTQIAAGTITASNINMANFYAASGTVTNTLTIGASGLIQSSNYSAGSAGWQLSQNGLEINGGTIRAAALALQVGHNIIPMEYADFEYQSSFYSSSVFVVANAPTLTIDTTAANVKYNGQSLKIVAGGSIPTIDFTTGATTYNIVTDPSTTYIVSMWVLQSSGVSKNVNIRFKDSATVVQTSANLPVPSGVYTRVSATFTTNSAANGAWVGVQLPISTTYWIDGVQVESQFGGVTTPSSWNPPSDTQIDGGIIRTGSIQSTNLISTGQSSGTQPSWSINVGGSATFANALVRGHLIVGDSSSSGLLTDQYIASANYVAGTSGYVVKGDGSVEFNSGVFRGSLGVGGTTALHIDTSGNLWSGASQLSATISSPVLNDPTFLSTGGTWLSGAGYEYAISSVDSNSHETTVSVLRKVGNFPGLVTTPVTGWIVGSVSGVNWTAATYFFVLTYIGLGGESLKSNEISVLLSTTTAPSFVGIPLIQKARAVRIYYGTVSGTYTNFLEIPQMQSSTYVWANRTGANTYLPGTSSPTITASAGSPPVSNTSADTSAGTLTITWGAVASASSYNLYRGAFNNTLSVRKNNTVSTTLSDTVGVTAFDNGVTAPWNTSLVSVPSYDATAAPFSVTTAGVLYVAGQATLQGTLRTSQPGPTSRIEIGQPTGLSFGGFQSDVISFYSGDEWETIPAAIGVARSQPSAQVPSQIAVLTINGPVFANGSAPEISLTSGTKNSPSANSIDFSATDVTIKQSSIPRGKIFSASVNATQSIGTNTEALVTGAADMSVVVPTGGRTYLIAIDWQVSSTSASDTATFRIRDGGASAPTTTSTVVSGPNRKPMGAANTAWALGFAVTITLTAGTHRLGLGVLTVAGAGTIGSAGVGQISTISISDIGV